MVQLQRDTGVRSIEFSEFAQLTAPYLKADMSQAEYARTLLLGICAFEDLDNNPVSKTSDESMKRYYTGERGIGSLAAKIVPYLDSEQLEPMFKRLGYEAEMELYGSLSPYWPCMTDCNVAEEALGCLRGLLQLLQRKNTALENKLTSRRNKRTCLLTFRRQIANVRFAEKG